MCMWENCADAFSNCILAISYFPFNKLIDNCEYMHYTIMSIMRCIYVYVVLYIHVRQNPNIKYKITILQLLKHVDLNRHFVYKDVKSCID